MYCHNVGYSIKAYLNKWIKRLFKERKKRGQEKGDERKKE
jgi:hypothetical protein